MVIKHTKQKEVVLAILFANGMLNSQLPAFSQTSENQKTTAIETLANITEAKPVTRAFYLLLLAHSYITEENRAKVDDQYNTITNELRRHDSFFYMRSKNESLSSWSEQAAFENVSRLKNTPSKDNPSIQSIPEERVKLANQAIERAMSLTQNISEKFVRLNLYFSALQLFDRTGNHVGVNKCQKILDEAFDACNNKSPIDEELIEATASILNSMAYALIPLRITDYDPKLSPATKQKIVEPVSESTFKKSQQLKLKAVALLDKLPKENHLRRKAHRDLVFWYRRLDKPFLAEYEKLVLFNLVGYWDESVLYPQAGACGHLIWWTKEKVVNYMACGMG